MHTYNAPMIGGTSIALNQARPHATVTQEKRRSLVHLNPSLIKRNYRNPKIKFMPINCPVITQNTSIYITCTHYTTNK